MAEALLQIVLENLNSLIQREIGLLWGVDKEMENLSSKLTTIRAVLEDAELKQLQSKPIQIWLRKLKHAVYDIDDVLDKCATEAARLKVRHSFLSCYSPLDNVLFRHKIGNQIKEINEKLNEIADERMKFHLDEVDVANRVGIPQWRETSSALPEEQVYGRENDKESIIEQLVKNARDCENVSVLPIIGMGGLGKTTLAQQAFNDERVIKHFEPRIWVCVSEDFEVKRLIKLIIDLVSGKSCEKDSSLEDLQRQLQNKLNGKRYLLVLDDVWNEDPQKWEKLKCVLAYGSKGASVITTTRHEHVALIMRTLSVYHLSGLLEDDCWSVFKQQAFKHKGEERPDLVAIGKEIVKKCGGVPLAAKALGSLLCFKNEESEWVHVKESKIWSLPQDNECSIMPALRLSYHNLPLECRHCFAYCAVFKKDSRIKKDHIIHLWMANNFISSNETMELEDIGNVIWKELHRRSFFQEVENDDFGNVESFKMHDLVHDLAQFIMEDECYVMEVGRSNNILKRSVRHVTSVDDSKALKNIESLRTLFVNVFSRDCIKFSTLRVLDASEIHFLELPSSIGNLIHLRYLNLSGNYTLRTLPESLCTLINLQTLNLNSCGSLQRLPNQMRRLTNLRHLFMKDCSDLRQITPRIGQLTSLKTLSLFIVDRRSGFHLGELEGLNLGGKLRIEHLERVENWVDAREANLIRKQNLYSLGLCWEIEGESESSLQGNAKQVLEALEPHPNLKELIIENYAGTSFPHWMMPVVLQNLVSLSLIGCKNCQNLPAYGQLCFLKRLEIRGMKDVKYIDDDDSNHGGSASVRKFPCLERVKIYELPCLERLSREEEKDAFPCLSQLSIRDCPKLKLSYLPSLKDLQVKKGCSDVLLSSISNLSCLTSLEIFGDEQRLSFPEGMLRDLTALQKLDVRRFDKLVELPNELSNLSALKSLCIAFCDELESLPEQGLQGLNSLRSLELRQCRKLKSLSEGLQHLKALESLDVEGCPELVFLPEGIKHLHSLRNLQISSIYKMVVLPEALQHVPALQFLQIWFCGELRSLPDWLGNLASLQRLEIWGSSKVESLPDSIQSLTNLTTLEIRGCGEQLKRRCEKGRGEDWYKIQHIPDICVESYKGRVRMGEDLLPLLKHITRLMSIE